MSIPSKSSARPLLAEEVHATVQEMYRQLLPEHLPFNNLQRLERCRQSLEQILKEEAISERPADLIAMALYFHFAGWVKDAERPVAAAKEQAQAFLQKRDYPALRITQIEKLLEVAGAKRPPESRPEKILTDALHSYFGQKKFRRRSDRLRREREVNLEEETGDLAWAQHCLARLEEHTFYTPTARHLYEERKQENIAKARKRIKKIKKESRRERKRYTIQGNRATRMIFKTALRNHIDLTNIADRKANMMLSINALILTIGLPLFSSYLSDQPYLFLPAGAFLLTAILSILFATLSTRPIKMTGETDLDQIPSGNTNLFFFGNFYKLSAEAYVRGIRNVLKDEEIVEQSIVNDLYYLGQSLGSKFRYLRICYNIFVIGISFSAVSFIAAFVLWG